MADNTAIEWADTTWNIATGCTQISPGCANCYIPTTIPLRMAGRAFMKGHIPLEIHESRLNHPLHWRKPRVIFVNSLSDLFHADMPEALIAEMFTVMGRCPQHRFLILTKRHERMREVMQALGRMWAALDRPWPLPNVWLGVSVENQHWADARIPVLLDTPAAVRFISAEPLLGKVDISPYLVRHTGRHERPRLDWVIVGGESGKGARTLDIAWARLVAHHCVAHGVAVFIKQLGKQPIGWWRDDGSPRRRVTLDHPKGGDPEEWPPDLRIRQFPAEVHA